MVLSDDDDRLPGGPCGLPLPKRTYAPTIGRAYDVVCRRHASLHFVRHSGMADARATIHRGSVVTAAPRHPSAFASERRWHDFATSRDRSDARFFSPGDAALVEAVARALRAAGAVIIEDPSPLFLGPPTDFGGPVRFGKNELWLAFNFLEARQNNQFFCVTLRAPPTGPPGVDLATPLEDTAATRSALEVVARALTSCHEHVRWCTQDEATDFVLYRLDSSPQKP